MPIYKMKGRKDNLQKYRVRVNYKDASGNDKQLDRVAYGIDAAKELERRLSAEVKESPVANAKMTVQALYDEYIAAKKYEVRETTISKTEGILKNHVLLPLGNKKLNQLTLPVLQKWKNEIEDKPLSVSMKKSIYAEFRTLLNYAVKYEYISSNLLSRIGNFKNAYETKNVIDYYTAEEFLKFITAAKKTAENSGQLSYEWNYYVFFNIAFYAGLRKGEINALKWSDIEGEYLHVRRSINQKLKGADRETPPKNKSSYRTLQMPKPLIDVLTAHRERQGASPDFADDWRICGGISCLRDTTVNEHNIRYANLAGIKSIRIHDYRHSHASLLANEGINIQEIARRLGHSKIEITWNTYSHLYPREEERAINILNKIV